MKNSIELKSQEDEFQSACFVGICVASSSNKTIELGVIEVVKKCLILKTNTDTRKLLKVMSRQMQVLLVCVNDDFFFFFVFF